MDHGLRDILRWQRIEYRMAALVWRCLRSLAPAYLVQFCGPTQSARSSRSLRSADQGLLRVGLQFARTSTRQKRAFAVVGPSIWNGLPLYIRSLPRTLSHTFLSIWSCWGWERHLKRRYINACNEWMLWSGAPLSSCGLKEALWKYQEWINNIFPLSVVDWIMGWLIYVWIHACMQECMYISVYVCWFIECMSGEWLYQCQNGNNIVDLLWGNTYFLTSELDFYWGYKFYRGSCLICLMRSYGTAG